MSGCYDYDYGYDRGNDWDYNDCQPRRRRHQKKHYNDCWDYSY